MDYVIASSQVEEFNRDGFIIWRQLFSAEEMSLLLQIAKADLEIARESYGREDAEGGVSRLALRNELDDSLIYSAIARSERVAGTMQTLLGAEVYHYHHKMMLKEPKVGGAWEWHQDYGYWYNFGCLFPDMASCLIAVDRATRENGCLQVLTGSHKLGRIDHGRTGGQVGADLERVAAAEARLPLVHCELAPGDAVFFHSNLLHRSDQNRSENSRWSLICCYNTKHNDPFITNGRHPNYSPLTRWPDARVLEVGREHLASIQSQA